MDRDGAAQKALVADWFGRAAFVYTTPFFDYPGYRLVELADVQPGAQALDIGTGTGAVLIPAAERAGAGGHVTGIDIAEEMVGAAARETARRGLTNADARRMDAEQLDFSDASFDYVLFGFGITFIPDLQHALAEMRRVLRPGGVLAVSTWREGNHLSARYRQLEVEFEVPRPGLGSHQIRTAESLKKVFLEAGFSNVQVTEETVKVIFDSKQEYWAQQMPVEQVALEGLGPEITTPFRRAVYDMLEDYLYIDGVHETRNVMYAVATAPK